MVIDILTLWCSVFWRYDVLYFGVMMFIVTLGFCVC